MFGHLFDGIKLGMHYDGLFLRTFVWAAQHGKTDCIHDLVAVAGQNIKEAVVLEANPVLLLGGDPFAASRKMIQDLVAKWGSQSGVH